MNHAYQWEELFEKAVLETDSSRLPQRLDAAQAALEARAAQLAGANHDAGEEHRAINDALSGLKVLRRERQGTQV
jgi:hypothetical protein